MRARFAAAPKRRSPSAAYWVRAAAAAVLPPAGFDELTARDRRSSASSPTALSNAEVADRLVITDSTVKTPITHILQKLGLRDRVQLIVLAYQAGLVEAARAPERET